MNHTILKAILAGLCLALPASTPAWYGEPSPHPNTQTRGYYPLTPWHGRPAPGVARPGPVTPRSRYPAPWSAPAQGAQPAAPVTRPRIPAAQPPAAITAPAATELEAELAAAREELRQNTALLQDAGRSLDRMHEQYKRITADHAGLQAELATLHAERDTARERETELAIELMAADKRLAQLSRRLEELEKVDATCRDERAEQERLLTDCASQLAELEALLQTGKDETNDLRSELATLEQQLDLKTAEVQAGNSQVNDLHSKLATLEQQLELKTTEIRAGNSQANDLRSELATLEQQLALMKVEVQAAAEALTRAQNETAAARAERDEQAALEQSCRKERDRLASALTQERGTHENAQRALAETRTAARSAQDEHDACNSALATARADLETAQEKIETLVTAPAAGPASPPPPLPDGDGDGVPDRDDRCPDTLPGADVAADGCAGDAPVILEGVRFRYDSHELDPGSHTVLDRVVASLRRQPALRLEIAGHTDAQGDAAYNQWLSQQRASRVMDYLVSEGIEPDRLTARGYGEQQPIADNRSREGLARNRRVELRRLP